MFVTFTGLLSTLLVAPPTPVYSPVSASEASPQAVSQTFVPQADCADFFAAPKQGVYYIMPEYWNPMGDHFSRDPY